MTKYFLFDCNGIVAGNREGYATNRAARQVVNNRKTRAYKQIQKAFDDTKAVDDNHTLLYEIRFLD